MNDHFSDRASMERAARFKRECGKLANRLGATSEEVGNASAIMLGSIMHGTQTEQVSIKFAMVPDDGTWELSATLRRVAD